MQAALACCRPRAAPAIPVSGDEQPATTPFGATRVAASRSSASKTRAVAVSASGNAVSTTASGPLEDVR